jgi:hypothetical protein
MDEVYPPTAKYSTQLNEGSFVMSLGLNHLQTFQHSKLLLPVVKGNPGEAPGMAMFSRSFI